MLSYEKCCQKVTTAVGNVLEYKKNNTALIAKYTYQLIVSYHKEQSINPFMDVYSQHTCMGSHWDVGEHFQSQTWHFSE